MIDPQRFFEQFDPSLYFVDPKPSSLEGCFIIAEQIVPSGRQAFSKTIKRWTLEPQFAIPPIDKAEIKSTLENNNVEIVVRALIPKRKTKDAVLNEKVEWMETDQESRVMYTPMVETKQDIPYYYPKVKSYSFVYTFAQEEEQVDQDTGLLRLEIMPFDSKEAAVTDPKMQYALKTILHKLFKWCIQARLGYKKKAHHDVLVPKETYQSMYQYLKTKYGPHLVSHWTEKTDPKKFVYEDIAIASYLICLWKEEEAKTKRAQTFIDLGCGNGLLTFLLVSEGYEGYGLDIADRKIWTSLCKTKDMLRVKTLYPAKASFPGTDWLIGNHADELVPWIPIIAQKSGENCKFMIIPCCFYGLDGTRSLSLSPIEGKYRAYTDYIKDIASQAGFACEEDYLRIPSTKNIAILGRTRKQDVQGNQLTQSIAVASEAFVPRKTDREKEKTRQEACKKLKTG